MTTMVQPRPVTPESEQGHPLLEALKARRTLLVRGGIALLVVVAGIWFYRESGRRKAQAGNEALDRARIAAETGNLPVASSELQKVAQTYEEQVETSVSRLTALLEPLLILLMVGIVIVIIAATLVPLLDVTSSLGT